MKTENYINLVIQVALVVKNPPASARDIRDIGLIPGWEDPLEEGMAWEIPWTRSLASYSPCDHKELDTTEQYTKICMKL